MEDNNLEFPFVFPKESKPVISIIGIGGGAGRIVNKIQTCNLTDTELSVFGMNRKEMEELSLPHKYLIGADGLGSGNDRSLAESECQKILPSLEKIITDKILSCFIVCLGGGTGEGCIRGFLQKSVDIQIKVKLLVVTLPHSSEGLEKREKALLLLDEIEKELGIATCPINWPIGSGKKFRGVYDRNTHKVLTFSDTQKGTKEGVIEEIDIDDARLDDIVDPDQREQLMEEIELLDGASVDFDQEQVSKGNMTPVFFGSALTNFGVETFLEHFLKMTTSPLPRVSDEGEIDPMSDDFSAFVFKIQANMNKAHRDRIAFMRICSGKFDASQEVYHVQGDKKMRLLQPQQMMAESRHVVDEAFAGDIIGVFDPGIFSIGDTICAPGKKFAFEGIPTFAPEHFARVRQLDTMKRKQFVKGINQIAQEGAIQIFQEFNTGMEEIIVGVVGVLQFDVLKYRLENEYNVEIRLENLPYEHIRWITNENVDLNKLVGTSDMKKIKDLKGNPLLLFVNSWSIGMVLDRNEGLQLEEFGRN